VVAVALAGVVTSSAGCKPDLGEPISAISKTRILAVRGTPPEAKEGAPVTFDVLAVDADGTIAAPQAMWAVCQEPRPPSETNSVAAACLTIEDQAGPSPTFQGAPTASDPNDPNTDGACNIFGPIQPKADPTARPRDPDITGGFYQPVRVAVPDSDGMRLFGFDLERVQCPLANAPVDLVIAFNNPETGYKSNKNPTLGSVAVTPAGGDRVDVPLTVPGSAPAPAALTVAPDQHVALEVGWPEDAVETFLVYDRQAVTLVNQREAVTVSWFASDGQFDHDVTGIASEDPSLTVTNGWKAPDEAKLVHLWVVLRDSRGGIDFTELAVNVAP
jgi:hypothetical protein